jgi:hypothetical protein
MSLAFTNHSTARWQRENLFLAELVAESCAKSKAPVAIFRALGIGKSSTTAATFGFDSNPSDAVHPRITVCVNEYCGNFSGSDACCGHSYDHRPRASNVCSSEPHCGRFRAGSHKKLAH